MSVICLLVLGHEDLKSKDGESSNNANGKDEETSNEITHFDHNVHVGASFLGHCALMSRGPIFLCHKKQ